jgi:hypothetical protein
MLLQNKISMVLVKIFLTSEPSFASWQITNRNPKRAIEQEKASSSIP